MNYIKINVGGKSEIEIESDLTSEDVLREKLISEGNQVLESSADITDDDKELGIEIQEKLSKQKKGRVTKIECKSYIEIAGVLKKRVLYTTKIFVEHKEVYVYVVSKGCYDKLSYEGFYIVICAILQEPMKQFFNYKRTREVWNQLLISDLCCIGLPQLEYSYIVFKNLTLDTTTLETFPHTPDVFTTNHVDYEYDRSKKNCPVFDKFIKDLACNYKDREIYLLCILNFVILSKVELQSVIYLFGPGSSPRAS